MTPGIKLGTATNVGSDGRFIKKNANFSEPLGRCRLKSLISHKCKTSWGL